MKIKVTASVPKFQNDGDIEILVGSTFDVMLLDNEGFYINYGPSGLYLIRHDECVVVGS